MKVRDDFPNMHIDEWEQLENMFLRESKIIFL